MNRRALEYTTKTLIELIGDDPKREGIVKTPERVAKMCLELFRANEEEPPHVTCEPNTDNVQGMLRDSGHFFSYCEHHMVPFFGTYQYAYIPHERIIGVSKIGRTIDYFSARLQVQERLCIQTLNHLHNAAEPYGSILLIEARHLCKEMRGLRKYNSPYEHIEPRGWFLENKDGCKDEFIARIRRGG